jgi:MFS family permease
VPRELLTNAVTWNSSLSQVSSTVGAMLAGLLITFLGLPAPYAFDFICALLFLGFIGGVKYRQEIVREEHASIREEVFSGLRFVCSKRVILGAITLDLFAVLIGGAVALLPIFATDILQVGAVGFGWLRAAPSLGALIMGFTLAHMPPMKRAGMAMLWSVAGFGLATMVFGLSRNFALSFVALAMTGALDNVSVVVRHSLVQMLTPDSMRGRVSAVNNVFINSSNELGQAGERPYRSNVRPGVVSRRRRYWRNHRGAPRRLADSASAPNWIIARTASVAHPVGQSARLATPHPGQSNRPPGPKVCSLAETA